LLQLGLEGLSQTRCPTETASAAHCVSSPSWGLAAEWRRVTVLGLQIYWKQCCTSLPPPNQARSTSTPGCS